MPFDEEDDVEVKPKKGLKIKNAEPPVKKPTIKSLQDTVKTIEENNVGYKKKATELTILFNKAMADKTLVENKTIFSNDAEKELISNMANLAIEVNNDPNEQEGMGSLMWLILLLKHSFAQRNKINSLEYKIFKLNSELVDKNKK